MFGLRVEPPKLQNRRKPQTMTIPVRALSLGHSVKPLGPNRNQLEIRGHFGNPFESDESEASTFVAPFSGSPDPVDVWLDGLPRRVAQIHPGQWAVIPGVCRLVNGTALLVHRPGYRVPFTMGEVDHLPDPEDPSMVWNPTQLSPDLADPAQTVSGFQLFTVPPLAGDPPPYALGSEPGAVSAFLVLSGRGEANWKSEGEEDPGTLRLAPGAMAWVPEDGRLTLAPEEEGDTLSVLVWTEGEERGFPAEPEPAGV